MTKRKRLKLLKERHLMWITEQIYEEDKHTKKDYHPVHPDNERK